MMNDEQPISEVLAGPAAGVGLGRGADLVADPDSADDSEGPGQRDDNEPAARKASFLTEMVVLFAVALTVALLIKSFVVQPFFIPSASMEQTLLIGDKVLVNK